MQNFLWIVCVCFFLSILCLLFLPLPLSCMACVVSQRPCWRWRLPVGLRVWYQPTRWLRLTSPTTRWNSGSSPIPPFLTPTSPTRICKEIIKIYSDKSSQMTHFCSLFRTNNRIKRLFFFVKIKVQCLQGAENTHRCRHILMFAVGSPEEEPLPCFVLDVEEIHLPVVLKPWTCLFAWAHEDGWWSF